jgi:hypothetical protein
VVVVPVVGNVPLQPPDAAQLLALVALHCNVTGAPMATILSLAFKVTNGGATTVGVAAPLGGVLLVGPLLAVVVSAFELIPHAAREPSAANPSIDFNASANPKLRLRRIELIRVSQDFCDKFFRGADSFHPQSLRSHIHSIFQIRQPVAICKLHMFSATNKFICVFENRKLARDKLSSRIGDNNAGRVGGPSNIFC